MPGAIDAPRLTVAPVSSQPPKRTTYSRKSRTSNSNSNSQTSPTPTAGSSTGSSKSNTATGSAAASVSATPGIRRSGRLQDAPSKRYDEDEDEKEVASASPEPKIEGPFITAEEPFKEWMESRVEKNPGDLAASQWLAFKQKDSLASASDPGDLAVSASPTPSVDGWVSVGRRHPRHAVEEVVKAINEFASSRTAEMQGTSASVSAPVPAATVPNPRVVLKIGRKRKAGAMEDTSVTGSRSGADDVQNARPSLSPTPNSSKTILNVNGTKAPQNEQLQPRKTTKRVNGFMNSSVPSAEAAGASTMSPGLAAVDSEDTKRGRRETSDPLTEPEDEGEKAVLGRGTKEIGGQIKNGNGNENGKANNRAPRKKRKWLKKGEVDPDDPVAVARQKERHTMIDQALADLDRQFRLVQDGTHEQLVEMVDELLARRDIQLRRLEARHKAALAELAWIANHEDQSTFDTWQEEVLAVQRAMHADIERRYRQTDDEKLWSKRKPGVRSYHLIGTHGGAGWPVFDEHVLHDNTEEVMPMFHDGIIRQRRKLQIRPVMLDQKGLAEDMKVMGVRQPGQIKSVARNEKVEKGDGAGAGTGNTAGSGGDNDKNSRTPGAGKREESMKASTRISTGARILPLAPLVDQSTATNGAAVGVGDTADSGYIPRQVRIEFGPGPTPRFQSSSAFISTSTSTPASRQNRPPSPSHRKVSGSTPIPRIIPAKAQPEPVQPNAAHATYAIRATPKATVPTNPTSTSAARPANTAGTTTAGSASAALGASPAATATTDSVSKVPIGSGGHGQAQAQAQVQPRYAASTGFGAYNEKLTAGNGIGIGNGMGVARAGSNGIGGSAKVDPKAAATSGQGNGKVEVSRSDMSTASPAAAPTPTSAQQRNPSPISSTSTTTTSTARWGQNGLPSSAWGTTKPPSAVSSGSIGTTQRGTGQRITRRHKDDDKDSE